MKICRFNFNNEENFGVIKDDRIFYLNNLDDFNDQFDFSGKSVKIEQVKLLPPVQPSKIVCVGRNYADHAKELGNEVPKEPLLFLKAPSSLITEDEKIVIPKQSAQVEHEGELGVVIKRKCSNLKESDNFLDYIFGFVCLNDVTARDLQKKDVQFTRAKSFDTFCPISFFIETELDFSDISVKTLVNNKVKQAGKTSQMVFSVDFLIRYISNQMTLEAGDLIATGTPSGVSKLNDGDKVEIMIENVGTLRNFVVDQND